MARCGPGGARRTYHVQGVAPGRGGHAELALLLSRGGAQDARAASEGPGSEFRGHCCGVVCVTGEVQSALGLLASKLSKLPRFDDAGQPLALL